MPVAASLDQIFNAFCSVVERELPDRRIWNALKRAPICEFDKEALERVDQVVQSLDIRELHLPPVMPFDEIAIVSPTGVGLMFNAVDYEYGEQLQLVGASNDGGADDGRTVSILREVYVVVFIVDRHTRSDGSQLDWWSLYHGPVSIAELDVAAGLRRLCTHPHEISAIGGHDGIKSKTRWRYTLADFKPAENKEQARAHFLEFIADTLSRLTYIDLPRHHVIVEHPVAKQGYVDDPKLPRAHDRDRLRLIEPEAVKTIYKPSADGPSAESTRGVTPHARRGYTKYLTSAKFTKKQWTRIRIRPTWVGDPEWQVGRTKYRVLIRGNDSTEVGG